MGRNFELAQNARRLVEEHGSVRGASRASGIPRTTLRRHLEIDPAILDGMEAVGAQTVPGVVWAMSEKQDGGMRYSVMLRPQGKEFENFLNQIRDTVGDLMAGKKPKLPRRFPDREGNILILDPADVHIGKLCIRTETGYTYDESIAEHRMIEGCRMLLEDAIKHGATKVALVIGNDISHIDTLKRTTTAGTPGDTSTSLFSIYRVAQRAYVRIVNMILEAGLHVVIVFNPSNHDHVLGFTIAQLVGAWFHGHPNVTASEYNLSEIHRKYMQYGRNMIGFTHGNGAKLEDLGSIMQAEVRTKLSQSPLAYWYVHHWHHKMRKALGVRPQDREKDHLSMTVMTSGHGAMEADNCMVEIVRSPSPPDGWHHMNGFLNRQAVEGFVHHPNDGQCARFTAWF